MSRFRLFLLRSRKQSPTFQTGNAGNAANQSQQQSSKKQNNRTNVKLLENLQVIADGFCQIMMSIKILNACLTVSCFLGLALSIYAYVVELQLERNEKHEAFCDISEHMSCSKAFKSPYGKGFGIFAKGSFFDKPNSLLGIIFYSLSALLAQSNHGLISKLSLYLFVLSNFASLYFAYILYFILYDLCIVCVSTYVVNLINLIVSYVKVKTIERGIEVDQTKKRY